MLKILGRYVQFLVRYSKIHVLHAACISDHVSLTTHSYELQPFVGDCLSTPLHENSRFVITK